MLGGLFVIELTVLNTARIKTTICERRDSTGPDAHEYACPNAVSHLPSSSSLAFPPSLSKL